MRLIWILFLVAFAGQALAKNASPAPLRTKATRPGIDKVAKGHVKIRTFFESAGLRSDTLAKFSDDCERLGYLSARAEDLGFSETDAVDYSRIEFDLEAV